MIIGTPPRRNWQNEARDTLRKKWNDDTSAKALIAACPGAGKTFFAASEVADLFAENKIHLAIIVVHTTNIQLQWMEDLAAVGLKVCGAIPNESLRWRRDQNVPMIEDNQVVIITYHQLALDTKLFTEMVERYGAAIVIADEVHHADEIKTFGDALSLLADAATYRLSLSGTPFNSVGGSLAMCECEASIDPDTGKPIRRTLATFSYSYAKAIFDKVCRTAEFIKVFGKGEATYRLLSTREEYTRQVDLAKKKRTDRLNILLDPDGEFMEESCRQAVRKLKDMRDGGDSRAAMLVVAKNKSHGALMAKLMERVCVAEGVSYTIQEIYNDSTKAHDRIKDLNKDSTDIVVSVRMLSEGVDVKRLRVGLFATDWMTRMFFIQFIGRFVRREDRLDDLQYAAIIIPAHIQLLDYANEIEQLIDAAPIIDENESDGLGVKPPVKSEFVSSTNQAGETGVIYRGEESEERALAEAFFGQAPSLRGLLNEMTAIKAAKEMGLNGSSPGPIKQSIQTDWSRKNDLMATAVVKRLPSDKTDGELYAKVNGRANRAVGIFKKDKLTPESVLIRRHKFLQEWALQLYRNGEDSGDINAA
jgi:superfamily II DNA or RNA helicase